LKQHRVIEAPRAGLHQPHQSTSNIQYSKVGL
jgi:hypothetical protein